VRIFGHATFILSMTPGGISFTLPWHFCRAHLVWVWSRYDVRKNCLKLMRHDTRCLQFGSHFALWF